MAGDSRVPEEKGRCGEKDAGIGRELHQRHEKRGGNTGNYWVGKVVFDLFREQDQLCQQQEEQQSGCCAAAPAQDRGKAGEQIAQSGQTQRYPGKRNGDLFNHAFHMQYLVS